MGLKSQRAHLRARATCLCAGLLLAAGFSAVIPTSAANANSGVTVSGKPLEPAKKQKTRFIVGLAERTDFHIIALANPNRVVVELGSVNLQLPPHPKSGPVGLISGFQGGKAGKDKSRVVIKVTEPVIVESSKLERSGKGYMLSLDIVPLVGPRPARKLADAPFEQPVGLGAAGLQPPMPRAAVTRQALEKRRAKQLIVLDPGHGGHDSGAKKNGVVEKDVVLAFAHTLRKKLEATGRYEIIMTRDDDTFVKLSERRKIAERNKAALFIAIHADYAKSSASGATVFSLRPSVAKRLKSKAVKKAGRVSISKDRFASVGKKDRSVVAGMLSDLARIDARATGARSDMFSRSVIRHMGSKTNFRSKPHRKAAFKVLKTHLVPSVLIELAFVTNKADAKRLTSEKWRKDVSGGIVTAVDNYFSHQAARLPILAGIE
ncbi:MAG: N-acetylmuramoyl-L-alanine amidase [Filomicrobium sp.]